MSDLGTALRELAREVDTGGGDARELWQRGRQRVRRRRAAVLGLAVVVGAVLLGLGAAGPEPTVLAPAGSSHGAGLPDRIQSPPSWLPATLRTDPLAVLGMGMRHGKPALFGIEASSGRYRFLDLADYAGATEGALSPNGRYVAYWQAPGEVTTALAVLDTHSGTLSGLDGGAESPQGITPERLGWLDDQTLLVQFDQDTGGGNTRAVTEIWQPDGYGPIPIDRWTLWSRQSDGSVLFLRNENQRPGAPVRWEHSVLVPVDAEKPIRPDGSDLTLPNGDYRAVSRSGRYVVALGARPGDDHRRLLFGTVDGAGTVGRLDDLGDLYVGKLIGWHSADTVLVTGWRGSPNGTPSLFEADLATGKARRIGDAGDDVDAIQDVAADLVAEPLVAGNPPRGIDPRIMRAVLGVGGAGTLVVVLWWRRRGRQ